MAYLQLRRLETNEAPQSERPLPGNRTTSSMKFYIVGLSKALINNGSHATLIG